MVWTKPVFCQRRARIEGFHNAVAVGVGAVPIAGGDIDVVAVGRIDRNGRNAEAGEIIRGGDPGLPSIIGLPKPAGRSADIEYIVVRRIEGNAVEPPDAVDHIAIEGPSGLQSPSGQFDEVACFMAFTLGTKPMDGGRSPGYCTPLFGKGFPSFELLEAISSFYGLSFPKVFKILLDLIKVDAVILHSFHPVLGIEGSKGAYQKENEQAVDGFQHEWCNGLL